MRNSPTGISVFKKYGEQLGLVGTWWSGQEKRVLSGIDGVLLVVVIGDGKLVVPVDFAIRRPDPTGPGAPCRDKLCWMQSMLDGRLAAFRRRGVALPPPVVVADSWFSFRTLKHLLSTGVCQVHHEDAYYGHLVLRLMGCLVLFYTSRVICKGRMTMEKIIFSLKHYWRFVDSEALELQALSWEVSEKAAWIQAELRDRKSQVISAHTPSLPGTH